MRRQKNMAQMKEEVKTPEKEQTKWRYAIYNIQISKHSL